MRYAAPLLALALNLAFVAALIAAGSPPQWAEFGATTTLIASE